MLKDCRTLRPSQEPREPQPQDREQARVQEKHQREDEHRCSRPQHLGKRMDW